MTEIGQTQIAQLVQISALVNIFEKVDFAVPCLAYKITHGDVLIKHN